MADRKVYIEGEATVMVPVRVKFSMMVRADSDASIDKAVKLTSQGKQYAKADVELLDVDSIIDINGYGDDENSADGRFGFVHVPLSLQLEAGVQEAFESGRPFTIHKSEVIRPIFLVR